MNFAGDPFCCLVCPWYAEVGLHSNWYIHQCAQGSPSFPQVLSWKIKQFPLESNLLFDKIMIKVNGELWTIVNDGKKKASGTSWWLYLLLCAQEIRGKFSFVFDKFTFSSFFNVNILFVIFIQPTNCFSFAKVLFQQEFFFSRLSSARSRCWFLL